ncbi:E3 SUMO-protein ligase KIAA1586-like [Scomber scombrus]|uniref:E3 SUMO-protein ligase KIAA1586-like n=1 Tax=Scomber scombrus TaxID=13677 RepID=A0AAV1Q0D7_SCOSC
MLAWLEKGQKRTRTGDGEEDVVICSSRRSPIGGSTTSRDLCETNEWLISKDKRLGCKVCSKVNSLATQTQQGPRLSHEWSGCLISAFGADKAKQLLSLRKKIKEHRDSKSHIKAAEIGKISSRNEIQKHIRDMNKTECDTSCRVFRTAYKIGKHGRPFTVMPLFFELLELDGTTANDITERLLACLHKNGFDDHFLDECFVAFGFDGASVMLGRRAGVATQLCTRFPHLCVWHCSNHRLELAVSDVVKERAKYRGLNDVFTSMSFVFNLGVMYDALTELSDLSRLLQKRDMTLPEADKLLARQVFESMVSSLGPYTKSVLQAQTEGSFKNVALHENLRIVNINAGQFFRSMAENIKCRMSPTTSSHVSTQKSSSHKGDSQLTTDIKALQPDTWPEGELDIQHGDEEVFRLCDRLKVERRRSKDFGNTRSSEASAKSCPHHCCVYQ